MEYGKRLSKTLKINYKALIYLLPIIFVFTIIFSIYIDTPFFILTGSMLSVMIVFISTQGDQHNTEAFENGIKTMIFGKIFREFFPYHDFVYICTFNIGVLPKYPTRSGLLVFFKKSHTYPFFKKRKYDYMYLMDNKQTPFNTVIPNMKKNIQNWENIYHPQVTINRYQEISQMYESWNSPI